MKLLKNKIFIIATLIVIVIAVSAVITISIYKNNYSMELNIEDGTVIHFEYGIDEMPDVKAIYKGTIYNKEGIEVEASIDGELNLDKLGIYHITYVAGYKDKICKSKVTVIVEDTTAPEITLVSSPDHYTSPVGEYEEEGYKAIDNYDGDITESVAKVEKNGIISYIVTDTAGNTAVVERKIIYKDVIAPVITLNDVADMTVEVGATFVDPGYQASDECDGDITANVKVDGAVDSNKCGIYTITYKVADSSGNTCEIVRNVTVADKVAPVISLQGDKNMYVKLGDVFNDPGSVATDNLDGDISAGITVSGNVDTSKEGNYHITYRATDSSGNVAEVTRSVYVYEKQMEVDVINPGNKVVYLTFDDGPGPHTERLLNILDKYGVKVTFFVTNQHSDYRNLIGEAHKRGHTIALHTYSHQYSIYQSEETYYDDLKKIHDICVAQTGVEPKIVRFPGGTSNTISEKYSVGIMTKLSKSLAYHGYLYSDWNVSSGDAGGANTSAEVATNVINGIKNNNVSIVLQHDTKGYSVDAVEQIVAWGLANGYTFLPMTENTPMSHHRPNN